MEFKIVEKKKDMLELEFDDKDLPNALCASLSGRGVDAYTYVPHPLFPACRLHIEAEDAMKEFKKSVDEVKSQWTEFKKAVK